VVKIPPKYADPKQTPFTWNVKVGKNPPQDFVMTD